MTKNSFVAEVTFNSAVQFNVRMGPDSPVIYSRNHRALKFLMTKSIFPGVLS